MTEQTQSFPGAFCEPCNKWRKPSMILADGSCPKCGTTIDDHSLSEPESSPVAADANVKIPWHFWVMVAATVLYLGWRVIQGVGSLF